MVACDMSIRDIYTPSERYTMFDVSLGLFGDVSIFTLLIALVAVFAVYWLYQATQ